MAETFVQVNVPTTLGKKLKTWESIDGSGHAVDSEAVTLTDSAGDEVVIYPGVGFNNGQEFPVSSAEIQVLASNALRKEAVIQNTGVANVRVGVAGLTTTSGIRLTPGAAIVFSMPFCYLGAVFVIAESSTDSIVLATESTAL